jgi:hypothetical protein
MSIFTYALPSGSTFRLTAPTGTTQLEADLIFYSQVAAGALVGYSPGQTLTSAETRVTKFALSRQDRGTAGVDTQAILSIVNSIPTVSGIPSLVNTPLSNPIGQADLVNVDTGALGSKSIGPLNSSQVQGILAQIANLVDQPATVMSDDKGVGKYGLSCVQLEQAGYVKPGTWQRFIFDPAPLTTVLAAPGIWTGQDGVVSAQDFLNNASTQTTAQTALLQNGYDGLVSAGVISPPATQSVTASVGQVYTQSGLQSLSNLSAATGASLAVPSAVAQSLLGTQYATLLSSPLTNVKTITSGAINSLNNATTSLTNLAGVASNLANTAVGQVGALVTNAGRFGSAAATAWSQLSTDPVGAVTGSVNNLVSGTVNNLVGSVNTRISDTVATVNNLTGSVSALAGNLGGSISALTSNLDITGKAGQFATAFSNPLASLNNLGNFDLNSINTNLTALTSGLTNTLTGGINTITGSLTTSLDTITGSLTTNIGSLTQGLSGSLTSLTGDLSSTVTNLTGSLGDLTNGVASNLGSLTGELSAGLGSLGDLSSLSSLGDLGGLGSLGGLFGGGGDGLVSSTQVAAGYSNTVNRATLDVAMTKIIGSDKVPTPIFDFPSVNSISLNASADITAAANILQNLKSQGGALLAQVQTATNSISAIAGSSSVGGAITNVTNAFNLASRII